MRFQLKREWVIPTTVGVVSFITGGASGLYLGLRRKALKDELTEASEQIQAGFHLLEEKLEERNIDEEFKVEEYKDMFSTRISELDRILKKQKGEHPSAFREPVPEQVDGNVVNIPVREEDQGWDWEEELAWRANNPNRPYVMHVSEWEENDNDLRLGTLTYYSGDDVLVDEQDTPIYNYRNTVGELKFGHGSGDPSVVFVCNKRLDGAWEILFDPGTFVAEILGAEEDNIKHSRNRGGVPKFHIKME